MVIKGILFDLDDTLINSGKAIIQHHIKIAGLTNRRIPSREEIASVIGMKWSDALEVLWPNDNNKKFLNLYINTPKEYPILPIAGATEIVDLLSNKYQLGIITGRDQASALKYIDQFGFKLSHFQNIITGSDKITKPNPKVFDLVLEKFENITKQDIIFVGDSIVDARCAINAKVNFVAVESGFFRKKNFENLGIHNILYNVTELPKFIESQFNDS